MEKIKIMVVDDSPFSVGMISNMLTEKGFEVIGSATGLQNAVEVISQINPDLVTMDMVMPGGDGIACTEAIRKIKPGIKVLMISSMMDGELIHRARWAKVSGFLQKPVEAERLESEIKKIMASEENFSELDMVYFTEFTEALAESFLRFFKNAPKFSEVHTKNEGKESFGLSVIVGIVGKYTGRMIFDLSLETARKMTVSLLGVDSPTNETTVQMIAELANIIAGNACSRINKQNAIYGLRVTPPMVASGDSLSISKAVLDTVSSVMAETEFGQIYISVGFGRSEAHE